MNDSEYQHPEWQKKRLEVMNAMAFACEHCGDDSTQLHVHHKFYVKGRKIWEYANDELTVLCSKCHEEYTQSNKKFKQAYQESCIEMGQLYTDELLSGFLNGQLLAYQDKFIKPTSAESLDGLEAYILFSAPKTLAALQGQDFDFYLFVLVDIVNLHYTLSKALEAHQCGK